MPPTTNFTTPATNPLLDSSDYNVPHPLDDSQDMKKRIKLPTRYRYTASPLQFCINNGPVILNRTLSSLLLAKAYQHIQKPFMTEFFNRTQV
jgi:hypothetical protein